MSHHIQFFVLHVGSRQTIGPDALRVMWATACESMDISVARLVHGANGDSSISYSLYTHPSADRKHAESRMRSLLEKSGYLFTLRSVTH